MEKFNKRTLVDVLVVVTCILVLIVITHHFYIKNKQNKEIKLQEYALKEQVVWDLYYNYENLKELASSWNTSYAKLSLDSNRDTIEYPKYTVKELTRMHNRIMTSIAFYENNPLTKHYTLDILQISSLYPVNYDSQELLNIYNDRDKLYTYTKDLNDIYVSLINTSKLTDSVHNSYVSESKFHPYFTSLRKLDQLIYNLVSDQGYPRNLKYAISAEKEFVVAAKNRLFDKQISDLRFPTEYRVYMPEALNLKQNMMACLGEKNSQIQNLEFEVNQGKTLLLVALDTLNNKEAQKATNKIVDELYACYENIKKDYQRKLFLYIENPDSEPQIKWPGQTNLVELSKRSKDSLFMFYEENSSPYIATGTFNPLYLWYPKTIDEAIKIYNKKP